MVQSHRPTRAHTTTVGPPFDSSVTGWRAHLHTARYWVAYLGPRRVVGAGASAVIVVVVAWVLVRPSTPPIEASIPRVGTADTDATIAPPTVTVSTAPIKVHVAGAVKRPGVYELAPGSRVVDAVRAAGGASTRADLEQINLAQVIIDTEQVFVPVHRARAPRVTVAPRLRPSRTGQSTATTVVPGQPVGGGSTQSGGGQARVNLNSATAAQLDSLPGIGPATAKAIVSHRQKKGPFAKVEDLLDVAGIGPAKFEALRDLVSV